MRALRGLATLLGACALVALSAGGCGEEEPQANVSKTETLGPASPAGDLEQSPAELRGTEGFTTLVSTQITTRGSEDTLIAGQVAVTGSTEPRLRLKIDGEVERKTTVEPSGSGANPFALVSCACKLQTGEHVVVLEGAAAGSTTRVGARTLVVFPEVDLADVGSNPIAESALSTEEASADAEGVALAQTPAGDGDGPALVIVSVAAPRSHTGAEDVRLAVTIGSDVADELAKTSIPAGKLSAYLDNNGAGEPVDVRAYTTAGQTGVGATSVFVCNCGLQR